MNSAGQIPSFEKHILSKEMDKGWKTVDNFIYSCSHGVRSPLKSMQGLVRIMQDVDETCPKEWNELVQMLQQSGARLQSILSHFQLLKKNHQEQLTFELIDFNKLIKDVLDKTARDRADLGINTSVVINKKGQFSSDPFRISTILSTLIDNAIVFSNAAQTHKTIALYVTCSSYSCSIQIHDNGIGIEPISQKKAFALFFRGSQQSKGAGIGLYLASQVTLKLNGTISLTSTPERGTIASLWIPNHQRKNSVAR